LEQKNDGPPWCRQPFFIAGFGALLAGNVFLFLAGITGKGALHAANLALLFMAVNRLREIGEVRRDRDPPAGASAAGGDDRQGAPVRAAPKGGR